MNNNEKEHVITAKDVFDTVAGTCAFVLAVVAIIAAIWQEWFVVKLSMTLFIVILVICCAWWWVGDKIEKLRK